VSLPPLTVQEQRVWAVLSHCAKVDVTPSLRDVARALGVSHVRVYQYLSAMYRKGYLKNPTTGGLYCKHVQEFPP
jgi:DNA-binding IclR family transcriptional regulator